MMTILSEFDSSGFLFRLLDASLKLTLLLAVLIVATSLAGRVFKVSAARRVSMLFLGSIAVPVITIASFLLPAQAPLWTIHVQEAEPISKQFHSVPGSEALPVPDAIDHENSEPIPQAEAKTEAPVMPSNADRNGASNESLRWSHWTLSIWLGGIALVAARLVSGIFHLDRRARHMSTRITSGPLEAKLKDHCREGGVLPIPELLVSADPLAMPMTWGAWRHRILLPVGAEEWEKKRLRMVLQHELAHIRRRDCLGTWAMRLFLAPLWFHPLAWVVAKRVGNLRERACDDEVTKQLPKPDSYAHELVTFSKSSHALPGSLAMSRPRRLEARIRAMYSPGLNRDESSRFFRGSVASLLMLAVLPMMSFTACQTTKTTQNSIEQKTSAAPPQASNIKEKEKKKPSRILLGKSVFPEPEFKRGERVVKLSLFKMLIDRRVLDEDFGGIENVDQSMRKQRELALELLSENSTIPKTRVLSAAQINEFKKHMFAYSYLEMKPISTGKEYELKVEQLDKGPADRRTVYNDKTNWKYVKFTTKKLVTGLQAQVRRLASGKYAAEFAMQKSEADLLKKTKAGQHVWKPEVKGKEYKSGEQVVENGGAVLIGKPHEWSVDAMSASLLQRAILALIGEKYPYDLKFITLTYIHLEVSDR